MSEEELQRRERKLRKMLRQVSPIFFLPGCEKRLDTDTCLYIVAGYIPNLYVVAQSHSHAVATNYCLIPIYMLWHSLIPMQLP